MQKLGIIAKYWNEEVLLPLFLSIMDQLHPVVFFLCDDGSTDQSANICAEFAATRPYVVNKKLELPKQNYFEETIAESVKINILLQDAYAAGCDWVLGIDVDEIPSVQLIDNILNTLPQIKPDYGIYMPIIDLFETPQKFILRNEDIGFNHYPCPHLKIFGKNSGFKRAVNGMNLDMGVDGNHPHIAFPAPYLHLKYLFKNRRKTRGYPIESEHNINYKIPNYKIASIPSEFLPQELKNWWNSWVEPMTPW